MHPEVAPIPWTKNLGCSVKSSAISYLSTKGAEDGQMTSRQSLPCLESQSGCGCPARRSPLAELAEQCDVHPNQIQGWKQKLATKADTVFGADVGDTTEHDRIQDKLHAKIGQLTMKKDFWAHRGSEWVNIRDGMS